MRFHKKIISTLLFIFGIHFIAISQLVAQESTAKDSKPDAKQTAGDKADTKPTDPSAPKPSAPLVKVESADKVRAKVRLSQKEEIDKRIKEDKKIKELLAQKEGEEKEKVDLEGRTPEIQEPIYRTTKILQAALHWADEKISFLISQKAEREAEIILNVKKAAVKDTENEISSVNETLEPFKKELLGIHLKRGIADMELAEAQFHAKQAQVRVANARSQIAGLEQLLEENLENLKEAQDPLNPPSINSITFEPTGIKPRGQTDGKKPDEKDIKPGKKPEKSITDKTKPEKDKPVSKKDKAKGEKQKNWAATNLRKQLDRVRQISEDLKKTRVTTPTEKKVELTEAERKAVEKTINDVKEVLQGVRANLKLQEKELAQALADKTAKEELESQKKEALMQAEKIESDEVGDLNKKIEKANEEVLVRTGKYLPVGIELGFKWFPNTLGGLLGEAGFTYKDLCEYKDKDKTPDPNRPKRYMCRLGANMLFGYNLTQGSTPLGVQGHFQFAYPVLDKLSLGARVNLGYMATFGGSTGAGTMADPKIDLGVKNYGIVGAEVLGLIRTSPSTDLSIFLGGTGWFGTGPAGGSFVLGLRLDIGLPVLKSVQRDRFATPTE